MDDEQLGQWCRDRWGEKEERLKQFYTNKEFQDTPSEEPTNVFSKAKEVLIGKNYRYLLYAVCFFTTINSLMYMVTWIPYSGIYLGLSLLAQVLVSMFGGGMDKLVLLSKQKEIEGAFAKMKKGM